MKKVVEINTYDYGSTGKIMIQIADNARRNDFFVYTFSRSWKNQKKNTKWHNYLGSYIENGTHHVLTEITGYDGCFSFFGTKKLLRKFDEIDPDIIHLHNLHGFYINLPMLFKYIKKKNISVIWTLHDCWAFTGHCPYFTITKCDKWKSGCYKCKSYKKYPSTKFDNSKVMWKLKKEWFTGVKDLTIVTPSQWLADLVKQSFLGQYLVEVINNGIDLSIFKPTKNSFKEKYNITDDKYIILGVAFGWGERKGLDVFIELAMRLDERFQIVLVGTNDEIDELLPNNIISIHRTNDQQELAGIYSAANLFVNPTREENYPTVNMESIACGTPVLTFKTGGSPEIVDETCGSVVLCNDIDGLEKEIRRISINNPFSKEQCLERARLNYDMNDKFQQYIDMYQKIIRK